MTRSEKPGHKFKKNSILYHSALVDIFSVDPRKPHSKIPKTHLSTAFWSWHSWDFLKIKVLVLFNFLKILFKKISILWHRELLDMFLCCFPKTALINIQNSPLQNFEVDIPGNFQSRKFFSQFSRNFVFKKFLFCCPVGFSFHVSRDIRKPH